MEGLLNRLQLHREIQRVLVQQKGNLGPTGAPKLLLERPPYRKVLALKVWVLRFEGCEHHPLVVEYTVDSVVDNIGQSDMP